MYEGHWLRIYRRLAFYNGQLPVGVVSVQERYVDDYHKLLIELEHLSGLDLHDFDISEQYLRPVKIAQDPVGKGVVYSSQRFIDKKVLRRKFRALARFFDQQFAEL